MKIAEHFDMKRTAAILSILFCLGRVQAQETETYILHQAVSNRETIVTARVIRFDDQKHLFHVRDYYENGRIQMDAFYASFDKRVIVGRLEGKNRNLRFSAEPDLGHGIHWQVYPGQEIYDWLLRYDRRSRK